MLKPGCGSSKQKHITSRSSGSHDVKAADNASCFLISRNKAVIVCFVALRPMSTAMVIAGRSVHLTTLFPGQA